MQTGRRERRPLLFQRHGEHRTALRRRGGDALGQRDLHPLLRQAPAPERASLFGLLGPAAVQKTVSGLTPRLPLSAKGLPQPLFPALFPKQLLQRLGRPLPQLPHVPPAHPGGPPIPSDLTPEKPQAEHPVPEEGGLPGQLPRPGSEGLGLLPPGGQLQTGAPVDLPLPAPPPAPRTISLHLFLHVNLF